MSAFRFLGDAFSAYFIERVLFDDPKFGSTFRIDGDVLRDGQRLIRDARKTLAYRANPTSTDCQLLRPLAKIARWNVDDEVEFVETIHGNEDGGFGMRDSTGAIWARVFCAAPSSDLDSTPQGKHRRFALMSVAARVLEVTAAPYALLVSRAEIRLVRRAEGGAVSAIAFDLDTLGEWSAGSQRGWRLLLGLTSSAALEAPRVLDRVVELGRREMADVGNRLGAQVLDAVTVFARGLYAVEANRNRLPKPGDETALAELYSEILKLLYRCLFGLFAEARGLVPIELPLYRDSYALSTANDAPRAGFADRIRALFVLMRDGADLGGGERIPAFGGSLFAKEAAPLVESLQWDDATLGRVVEKLSRIDDPRRGLIPISYRELDEERLGSIYEGLLELRLSISGLAMERIRVGQRELVIDPSSLQELSGYKSATDGIIGANGQFDSDEDSEDDDGTDVDHESEEDQNASNSNAGIGRRNGRAVVRVETIPAGVPYLASSSGRKESASYYTSRDLVDFLVRETIDPRAERAEPGDILKLRVVDPAMGSGHFLIGAMRRLAEHLLAAYRRVEERDGHDALPVFVAASWSDERELIALCRQLVAVHCLYGVDKNPLAADLARVALWLATAAADHPLSFLDHRLRTGDSLFGLSIAQVVATDGIVSKTSIAQKKSQQYSLLLTGDQLVDEIALGHAVKTRLLQAFNVMRGFLAIVDDEQKPFALKRELSAAVTGVLEPISTLHAARAGFLLGDNDESERGALLGGLHSFGKFGYLEETDRLALAPLVRRGNSEKAFCWELEFPDAYYHALENGRVVSREDAGFDVVLGNPPWDKIKVEQRAFYLRYDPLIVDFQGRGADARIRRIDGALPAAPVAYRAAVEKTIRYVRALSKLARYEAQAVKVDGKRTGGDPDTFKFFFERGWQIACPRGLVGLVVPAAFTTGDGTTGLRRLIFNQSRLQSLFVFENRKRLFPIDSRFKFQTIVFERGGHTEHFEAAFWLHETDVLRLGRVQRSAITLSLTTAAVRQGSPERLAILEVRSIRDLQIAQRLLAAGAPLGVIAREHGAAFGSELHMSQDRRLFRTKEALISEGAHRENEIFITQANEKFLPLREGRMVQAFDANAKRYVRGEGRSAEWSENGWPKEPIEPHYWVSLGDLEPAWTRANKKLYWCDVTGSTNERTAMAALVDGPAVSGHSLAAIYVPDSYAQTLGTIAAVFNSFVLDWYVRQSVAQHMSFNFVEPAPFVRSIPYPALANDIKAISSPTVGYIERADLRAKLDAAVALAYGLSFSDFMHILASFPLLDRAEPALEGEAKSTITRDLALAAYCELAGEHDPEHADRVRAARAIGSFGYVATPLRSQLPNNARRSAQLLRPSTK